MIIRKTKFDPVLMVRESHVLFLRFRSTTDFMYISNALIKIRYMNTEGIDSLSNDAKTRK